MREFSADAPTGLTGSLGELVRSRDLLWSWAVLEPLALMLMFTLAFSVLADIDTGDVPYPLFPQLEPYLSKAAVLVVPVRVGGGMRVRILEAFGFAIPIVTTTAGLEGTDAVPGEHVLVGDKPEVFASHVVSLLKDERAQATFSTNGRWLAEARYDRNKVLKKLDLIYG